MWLATFLGFTLLVIVVVVGGSLVYHGLRYQLPYAPSSRRSIEMMLSHVDIINTKTVLDIGAGTGDVLLAVAEKGGTAIGIEINHFLVWLTRARLWYSDVSDKATILQGDMFSVPLPPVDVVILYTLAGPTARLAPKLLKELPSHCVVISHAFPLPGWKAAYDSDEVKVYHVSAQSV